MNPLSLSELKAVEPKQYCSECDTVKPISQFPMVTRGLKTKPKKVCSVCSEKKKIGKVEAEVLGKSDVKPLLGGLDKVMAEDELDLRDELRSKECKVCEDIKDFEDFDTSDTICEECIEEEKRLKSLKKHVEKTSEPIKTNIKTKHCTKCGEDKLLSEFHLKQGMNRKRITTELELSTSL
jgi:hypothetical protein